MRYSFLISIILFVATVQNLFLVLYQNKSKFLTPYNEKEMNELYNRSQWNESQNISPMKLLDEWAIQKQYTGWNNFLDENKGKIDTEKVKYSIIQNKRSNGISDTQLYSYAGFEYIRGKNPTLLNPEHPPFGKYLIGLSILLFQNENIILLLTGLIILIVLCYLVFVQTRQFFLSMLVVFLTSTNSLFVDQLIHGPQLELFQLMFFILTLLFLLRYESTKHLLFLILAGIGLGLMLSIKTFFAYFPLFIILFFTISLNTKNFKIRQLIFLFSVGLITFVGTYFMFFYLGGTLKQFLGVQKHIIVFYKQSGINVLEFAGNYLRLIFTGTWRFWSEKNLLTNYNEWSISWPILFIVTILFIYNTLKGKIKPVLIEKILILFFVIYNLFLFFTPIFPRYLLLLLISMALYISISFRNILKSERS